MVFRAKHIARAANIKAPFGLDLTPESKTLSFEFAGFKPLTFHMVIPIYSCVYQCVVLTKQANKQTPCEEILACKRSRGCRKRLLLSCIDSQSQSSAHATDPPLCRTVHYTLNVSSSGPSQSDCSRLDTVAASIFAMLAAYSGPCAPEDDPDPLNSELFTMSIRYGPFTSMLHWSVVLRGTIVDERFFFFERG